ncbi:hypothetical protein [Aquamicrobium ahrensii]|uniref:Uncharacterized protein n=1 Tax=Aquamicrobium ahrensii TaxID=469551 RepID=A0ABV2KMU4_9HYPH
MARRSAILDLAGRASIAQPASFRVDRAACRTTPALTCLPIAGEPIISTA